MGQFNLIGMFMMLKVQGETSQQHCDSFVKWWITDAKAPKSTASAITFIVAKKCNVMIPGIFDEAQLTLRSDTA